MQDNEIIDSVLIHLQGYVVESDEPISDLEYDKKVSSDEVLTFYRITTSYVKSYINQSELPTVTEIVEDEEIEVTDPIVLDALSMWTAGRLWQKYNVRTNNQEDETNILGFGDKLVIQAKEILKPYKYYKMDVY